MPDNIGPAELVLLLVIALMVCRPGKLPAVGAAVSRTIRELREAAAGIEREPAQQRPALGSQDTYRYQAAGQPQSEVTQGRN